MFILSVNIGRGWFEAGKLKTLSPIHIKDRPKKQYLLILVLAC